MLCQLTQQSFTKHTYSLLSLFHLRSLLLFNFPLLDFSCLSCEISNKYINLCKEKEKKNSQMISETIDQIGNTSTEGLCKNTWIVKANGNMYLYGIS